MTDKIPLLEGTTPGPWYEFADGPRPFGQVEISGTVGDMPVTIAFTDIANARLIAAAPDLARKAASADVLAEALESFLNFTRKSRQGYVLIPYAQQIVECKAEHALALASGHIDYAKAKAEQLHELQRTSDAEIDSMNAALTEHKEKPDGR